MQKYTKEVEFTYEFYRLKSILEKQPEITKLSQAQEIVAQMKGFNNWHEFQTIYKYKDQHLQNNAKKFNELENLLYLNHLEDNKVYQFFKQLLVESDIKLIDIPIKKQQLYHIQKIDNQKGIYAFDYKIKKMFGIKKENVYFTPQNFPMMILGSSGSGKNEVCKTLAIEVIENHKGLILLDAIGYDTIMLKTIMIHNEQHSKDKNVFILNFNNSLFEENKHNPKTNSFNPLDLLLVDKDSFYKVFGEDTAHWLYPALNSYNKQGKKVSIESLQALFSIPQLFKMANSNEWNNQKEVLAYLFKLDISLKDEFSTDELEKIAYLHFLYSLKAFQVITIFNQCLLTGSIENIPDIDFVEAIRNKDKIYISLGILEKMNTEYHILKNIIQEIVSIADKIVGHKDNYILFLENSYPKKMNSNKIVFTSDIYAYQSQIYNYYNFIENIDIDWLNWKSRDKDLEYKTFFLMKQEDPEGFEFIKNNLISKYWGYKNLEKVNKLKTIDLKDQREGEGYLIFPEGNKSIFVEQSTLSYRNVNYKNFTIILNKGTLK